MRLCSHIAVVSAQWEFHLKALQVQIRICTPPKKKGNYTPNTVLAQESSAGEMQELPLPHH